MTRDKLELAQLEIKRLKDELAKRERRCTQLDKIIRRMRSDNDELRTMVKILVNDHKEIVAKLQHTKMKLPDDEMTGARLEEMMKGE